MALSTKRPSEKNRLLKEVRETATPTKRLNIDVEATLYRRMKTQAVKEDRTLSDHHSPALAGVSDQNSIE